MNLSRSLAGFLSSSNPKKWDIIQSASALQSIAFSTERLVKAYQKSSKPPAKAKADIPLEQTTLKNTSELPRPSLIPFQAKVANSVHLVGTIDTGVKLQQHSDGIYACVSIIVNENMEMPKDTSRFWIPIIFRGDLAEIAACHLKKNDLIYVSGQLTRDNVTFTHEDTKENIKLIAHSLNFVKDACSPRRGGYIQTQDEVSTSDSVEADPARPDAQSSEGDTKTSDNVKRLWDELVIDPEKWLDNREGKQKGLLSTKNPDFKHKETGNGLWLNTAPSWVVPRLEGLVFGDSGSTTKVTKSKFAKSACQDDLWKRLIENPKQWWDNRSSKLKPTYPDFKHKDDGDALWLNSAPSWVLPMLPPQPAGKNVNNK
ncbi:protein OSB3, chloroplastic/mitochondrial isoform X2 [Dendrobium catenatum]|uniref:protein OSB3, chloroplastic/mitochondrial isoform X2 n=1 Tax=Dendrobium catenatum TaxID=906689 RepID=UPI0009F48DFE|nr:protein OSB3, chloroplastic/mitochondrial isoform X2 [Dendrobium catenatum]